MPEVPLTMPKMSMTMEEGIMVAWLKQPGDRVRSGDAVAEVTTDKVDMEVESPHDGTLVRIVAEPEDVVAVGQPIGYLDADEDDLLGGLFDGGAQALDPAPDQPAPDQPALVSEPASTVLPAGSTVVPAVPAARGLAKSLGVDLAEIPATGKWGSVTVADVERIGARRAMVGSSFVANGGDDLVSTPGLGHALRDAITALTALAEAVDGQQRPAAKPTGAAAVTVADAKRRRVRQQISKVMSASAGVPQFTVWADLDLSMSANARAGGVLAGISWTAILLKAQAVALSRTPALLTHWADGQVQADSRIAVAMAVDGPTGLLAPVVQNPHQRPLAELAEIIAELVSAVRCQTLSPDLLSGATTVLSNLGGFQVDSFNALLTPPQATALSVGTIKQRLVVVGDGEFAARPNCTVGLTIDHRVADGADGGRFIQQLRAVLADPEQLA